MTDQPTTPTPDDTTQQLAERDAEIERLRALLEERDARVQHVETAYRDLSRAASEGANLILAANHPLT